jgi:hypothetical protein
MALLFSSHGIEVSIIDKTEDNVKTVLKTPKPNHSPPKLNLTTLSNHCVKVSNLPSLQKYSYLVCLMADQAIPSSMNCRRSWREAISFSTAQMRISSLRNDGRAN